MGEQHLDISSLEEELTRAPVRLKRNRAYRKTIGGLQVVAIDGTETFRWVMKRAFDESYEFSQS